MMYRALALALGLQLVACAAGPSSDEADDTGVAANAWTLAPLWKELPAPAVPLWEHYRLPGKPATSFRYRRKDGRDAMEVKAVASASALRQKVHIAPSELRHIKFSWKVPALIAEADMAMRDTDDSPVRVVLAFEGDRSLFSSKNTMLSELLNALTGEPLPYATLMYVWCNTRAPDSIIINPRTDRIRKLVVASGGAQLNQWLEYQRDIRTDFERAFGEPPGALIGIGIMSDTDNTKSTAQAWYGPVSLTSAAGSAGSGNTGQ